MNNADIKELIDYCETTNLIYFEYISNDEKLVFSKTEKMHDVYGNKPEDIGLDPIKIKVLPGLDEIGREKNTISRLAEKLDKVSMEGTDINGSNKEIIDIRSPYVGEITFSEKILNGDLKVKENNILCSIEAMKIYNDIVSPLTGVIKKILVENGSIVEYDQLIMNIEAE